MRFEFSAGGIVYKHEVPLNEDARSTTKNIVVLVAQHSQHHGWVFPKGLINEKSKIKNQKSKITERETKEEAALREVREETGINGKIIKPLTPVTYWYAFSRGAGSGSARGSEKVKKTVYYFLMEYVSGDTKDHDFEMENVEWLAINEVEDRLTYKSDKEVWKEAMSILNIKD